MPDLVPKADLEHMASGAPPRAFERGMDPSEVITPLASDCLHYRALLEEALPYVNRCGSVPGWAPKADAMADKIREALEEA